MCGALTFGMCGVYEMQVSAQTALQQSIRQRQFILPARLGAEHALVAVAGP